MPTYEYVCTACKKKFSLIMTVAEHETKRIACPKCKSRKVRQRISTFHSQTSRKS